MKTLFFLQLALSTPQTWPSRVRGFHENLQKLARRC